MEGYYNVKRLALVLAKQAEVEGMKADNLIMKQRGLSPTYAGKDFMHAASELENLAHSHDHQL